MTGGTATNAHCRFYSGDNTTERMFIQSDGKIGINTDDPTEIFDVNGSVNVSAGSSFKIGGTTIVHTYHNGTNITIDTNKNINLNSPLLGISDIQNTGDIVFTRNSVQICRIQNGGITMVNNKKIYGEVVGDVKPCLIENISDFDQPIVSYQARTASLNPN
jgi:hypothetical protein